MDSHIQIHSEYFSSEPPGRCDYTYICRFSSRLSWLRSTAGSCSSFVAIRDTQILPHRRGSQITYTPAVARESFIYLFFLLCTLISVDLLSSLQVGDDVVFGSRSIIMCCDRDEALVVSECLPCTGEHTTRQCLQIMPDNYLHPLSKSRHFLALLTVSSKLQSARGMFWWNENTILEGKHQRKLACAFVGA